MLEERRCKRVGTGAHEEGIAIRRRLRDRVGADRAAGTGPVFHDKGLAELLRELGGDGAGDDVVRPPAEYETTIFTVREG